MPERNCSAMRAEVKKPSAKTTRMKGGRAAMTGNSFGTTWYQRKICTSSGTLRNSSTQALPKRTSHGLSGSVRIVPMTEPTISASARPQTETDSVQPQADSIHCQ
jgi:hypothetical protein